MKAIIPVAGAGTRLRPHTYTQPKALIPIAGHTVLGFIVDQLRFAGVNEFIFIVGYLGEKIKDYINQHYKGLNATFVVQEERYGIGHAILKTEKYVHGDEIIIVLGDTLAEYNVLEVVQSPISLVGVKKVDDPRSFGVASLDENGFVRRMVEKPAIPKSNFALIGVYKIIESTLLFECLHQNETSDSFTDLGITAALDCMVEKGVPFQHFKVENWYDCGRKETLIESNAILLKKMGSRNLTSAHYINSVIVPPVSIGVGTIIKNSVVGPNVTIGDYSTLRDSIVKESIVGSYTQIEEIVISKSLIGSDTEIRGVSRNLNIGDNTTIDLGGH